MIINKKKSDLIVVHRTQVVNMSVQDAQTAAAFTLSFIQKQRSDVSFLRESSRRLAGSRRCPFVAPATKIPTKPGCYPIVVRISEPTLHMFCSLMFICAYLRATRVFYALPLASCCAAVPSVLPMCELYVSCARLQATLLAVPVFWFGDCQGVHPAQRAAVALTFLFRRRLLIMCAMML